MGGQGIRIHAGISGSFSFLGRTVYNTDCKKKIDVFNRTMLATVFVHQRSRSS